MGLKGSKYFIYHINGEFPPKVLIEGLHHMKVFSYN